MPWKRGRCRAGFRFAFILLVLVVVLVLVLAIKLATPATREQSEVGTPDLPLRRP
jgi:hypothetical protein